MMASATMATPIGVRHPVTHFMNGSSLRTAVRPCVSHSFVFFENRGEINTEHRRL